jgi:Uma2 family endonuclease
MTTVSHPPSPPASRRPTLTLPTPPLTVADLDEIGLDDPRLELVDGMWVVRPWATPLRTRVTQRLTRLLAASAPDGQFVFPNRIGIQINDRTELSPDIVVAAAADAELRRLIDTPYLVVEVTESANRRYGRTVKLDLYRERGVPACWLVDPDTPAVEAWELVDGAYVLSGRALDEEELTVTRPFPVTLIPAALVRPPSTDPD